MNLSAHEIGFESLDALTDVDSLCVFVASDERPLKGVAGYLDWRLCGRLSRVLVNGFFAGAKGEQLLLPSEGRVAAPRVFVLGLGPAASMSPQGLSEAMTVAAQMLSRAKVESVALEVPAAGTMDEALRASAVVSSFVPGFSGQKVAVLAEKGFARLLPTGKGEK